MSYVVAFDVESGDGQVLADIVPRAGEVVPVGVEAGRTVGRAVASFDAAMDQVRLVAEASVGRVRSIATPPDELTLEFGVRLAADIGAVITSASAEANLTVSLKWTSHAGN